MSNKNWEPKQDEKVVLASDPDMHGTITAITPPYSTGDPTFYYVQWKGKSDTYPYIKAMIMQEDKGIIASIVNAIKSVSK